MKRFAAIALPAVLVVFGFVWGAAAAEAPQIGPGSSPPGAVPTTAARIASALADSLGARLISRSATVMEMRDGRPVLDIGARDGLRAWSLVTLVTANQGFWNGQVKQLEDRRAELIAEPGEKQPAPGQGSRVGVRLNLRRLALPGFKPGDGVSGLAAWGLSIGFREAVTGRLGLGCIEIPAYPDTAEARTVAATTKADMLLLPSARVSGTELTARFSVFEARQGVPGPDIIVHMPLKPEDIDFSAFGETPPESPPPGCRLAGVDGRVRGPILDLFLARYRDGGLEAVFPDRIEDWQLTASGIKTVRVRDLLAVWPPAVSARWPVAAVLPVNSFFDKDGLEAKVYYTICSNQRPRFLNVTMDRATPDSIYLRLADGPRDTLKASFGGCFGAVDRLNRPERYRLPPGMPGSARTRRVLAAVDIGPAGRPALDADGRPQLRQAAVIYYDEPSATVWFSAADTAYQMPGHFGGEMDTYRIGLTGPPGLVVTSARAPADGDQIELWVLRGKTLQREWESGLFPGAITALEAGDRDGDSRDDLVVGVVERETTGFRSRIYAFVSRPGEVGMAR